MKNNFIIKLVIACILLLSRTVHGQSLTFSVEGFRKSDMLRNDILIPGPLSINNQSHYYSYGLTIDYQRGNNGLEFGISNYPYRVNLKYNAFISSQLGPSNIALFSILYKRKIIDIYKKRITVYGLVGVGLGAYSNQNITQGVGTVTVNGTIVYESHVDRYSHYDKSTVVIPEAKIEIDKNISPHLILSLYGSYFLKNGLGNSNALEQVDYSYIYYQQIGKGSLKDLGNSYLYGIGIKYKINLQ